MRHSTASLLSAEGVPLERVADTLGHDGTRMVREVYRHAIAPTVDAAADPMQRLFGSRSGSPESTAGSPAGSPTTSEDAHNDE